MEDQAREFLGGLKACCATLSDPRVEGRCEHRLLDIIAITVLAVLCGADDWTDIEEFGQTRADWLQMFLELPHGIPSHE